MSRFSLINDLEMYPMGLNEFETKALKPFQAHREQEYQSSTSVFKEYYYLLVAPYHYTIHDRLARI